MELQTLYRELPRYRGLRGDFRWKLCKQARKRPHSSSEQQGKKFLNVELDERSSRAGGGSRRGGSGTRDYLLSQAPHRLLMPACSTRDNRQEKRNRAVFKVGKLGYLANANADFFLKSRGFAADPDRHRDYISMFAIVGAELQSRSQVPFFTPSHTV